MRAKRIFYRKIFSKEGRVTEMVIWQLPMKSIERPHGLKYRLYHGDKKGKCLVRYDNERGKGDHKHIGNQEFDYTFTSLETLIADFLKDVREVNSGGE